MADMKTTVQQQLAEATIGSLRGHQYTDIHGELISMFTLISPRLTCEFILLTIIFSRP